MLLRGLLAVTVAAGLLAGALHGQKAPTKAPEEALNVDKLNKKIDNFTLPDGSGKVVSLDGLKAKKLVVVVFLSFECPVSTSYAPTLAELAKGYAPKGVAFLGVNSSDDGSAAQLARQAGEYKLPFPVLKDDKLKAADLFKARTVPEAFVLDHNRVLRYRGRIDNAYSARLKRNPRTTQHDLRQALDELLAGRAVATPATRAIGCPIPREAALAKAGKVTYYRDVAPILQENCQQCHRPGEVGPFSLMNYKQAVNWASDIKEYTRERRMPPWKPVEGLPFHNDRRLTQKQIDTLAAWVDGGTPEGDPKDAPAPKKFTDGWQLGKPDLVLEVAEDFTLGPSGKDVFRCFVLPTGLKEDKFVTAVEVRPGNSRVVHHSLNFFDKSGRARAMEKKERDRVKKPGEQDHGPGYSVGMGIGFIPEPGQFGGIGGWAPGQRARHLPDGYGYPLPKGSDFVLQLHYHRNGRAEKDRTRIGLYFAKKPGTKPYKAMVIPGIFPGIPGIPGFEPGLTAGKERIRIKGGIEVLEDCQLRSVMPHMHMLGKEIKVTMTPPGAQPVTLVNIKDWDYNWQETYYLKEPIAVKKGTLFRVEAIYDNSAKNPNNPFDPPRRVRFGEQTDNEMCFVFLGATNDMPGRIRVRFEGVPNRLGPPRPADEEAKPGQGKPPAPAAGRAKGR
jgi:peroxiredoxin